MSTGRDPRALRETAAALREQLERLERSDWPRWLREADAVTIRISELLRTATELEHRRDRRC